MHNCFEITTHTHRHVHTHAHALAVHFLLMPFHSISFRFIPFRFTWFLKTKRETRASGSCTFCRVLKITFWPILFLGFCLLLAQWRRLKRGLPYITLHLPSPFQLKPLAIHSRSARTCCVCKVLTVDICPTVRRLCVAYLPLYPSLSLSLSLAACQRATCSYISYIFVLCFLLSFYYSAIFHNCCRGI